MQKPRYTLFAAGAYLALVGTLVITTSRSGITQGNGQPPGKDVRVINTTSEPVPVTGTLGLTPGGNIGIDPASDGVTIKNAASEPVPVTGTFRDEQDPGRQPFSIRFPLVRAGPFTPGTFVVPGNKRLVITHVEARAAAGNAHKLTVLSTVNGQESTIEVPFSTIRNSDIWLNEQVMGFADPGTTVKAFYISLAGDSADVNIHGYHVDVP